MGNLLFQQAREAVSLALNTTGSGQHEMVEKAKNALTSAYTHSSTAEKAQLREMQEQLQNMS
ncbi:MULTISPECIES: DUF3813 domain-containing protein [Bacillaceae]|jgi:hypothetical protein|uniref:DUF3813 domain-containing protein n=1 Tax=Ectobacillus funiculus TaxID=137993 RepID=A0ABV5WPQ5_9BACI|nr:DUF3813 domain-containing protein [Ectobacillus funiculus]